MSSERRRSSTRVGTKKGRGRRPRSEEVDPVSEIQAEPEARPEEEESAPEEIQPDEALPHDGQESGGEKEEVEVPPPPPAHHLR